MRGGEIKRGVRATANNQPSTSISHAIQNNIMLNNYHIISKLCEIVLRINKTLLVLHPNIKNEKNEVD